MDSSCVALIFLWMLRHSAFRQSLRLRGECALYCLHSVQCRPKKCSWSLAFLTRHRTLRRARDTKWGFCYVDQRVRHGRRSPRASGGSAEATTHRRRATTAFGALSLPCMPICDTATPASAESPACALQHPPADRAAVSAPHRRRDAPLRSWASRP